MIWNCCTFFNEFDLLRIQVEETRGLDIRHIVVEANWTFSGKEKPCYSRDVDDFPEVDAITLYWPSPDPDPWANERNQRNAILTTLLRIGLKDDDIVIIRDADEVVKKNAIKSFTMDMECAFLEMRKYNYFLNVYEGPWNIAKIMTGKYLKAHTPDLVRNSGAANTIIEAGWHWSFLGGVDAVLEKFASFSHQEEGVQRHAVRENIEHKLKTAESLWSKDPWEVVEIDSSFPQYVQEHQHDTLKHLIWTAPQ